MRSHLPLMLRLSLSMLLFLVLLSGCGGGAPTRPGSGAVLNLSELVAAYDMGDYNSVIGAPSVVNLSPREQTLQDFIHLSAQLHTDLLVVTEAQFVAIDLKRLPLRYRLEYQLNYATFIKRIDAGRALQMLSRPAVSTNTLKDYPNLFAKFFRLRAEINNQMGLNTEAANDYIRREQFLKSEDQIAANQATLWILLSQLSQERLDNIILGTGNRRLQGWADLIAITRQLTRYPDELTGQVTLWKRRYREHPAQEKLIADLLKRSHELTLKPKNIAVLLPLSGSYAKAASALKDGILASYLADSHRHEISLSFYDTAGNPDTIEAILQKSIADGAEFIIGPLSKKVVQEMNDSDDSRAIPTLNLNLTNNTSHDNLYQFSLSPEGEATNAANRAWHEGYSRISMLLPENSLGKRMSNAFRKQWEAYGGSIANISYYDPKLNDFATPIKAMLDIDNSENRRRALRSALGNKFEYTPRPREDIELIFLSAQSRQARIIKPQLRFHHAGKIPVIATSHLYSGKPDRRLDRDMDGILFEDMPWNIRQTRFSDAHSHLHKKYSGQLKRLVAMGIDSYQIIPLLPVLSAYPNEQYMGESGQLSVDKSNRIARKLFWSQFNKGIPRPVKDFIYVEPPTAE